jgi:SAM-dependent methyltransferase
MTVSPINSFDDLFEEDKYVLLKNYLYNYLLRKHAVGKNIRTKNAGLILEVGSGLSPMITSSDTIVYSELSLSGLLTLKHRQGKGWYVVADATHLPFRSNAFTHAVCSEVLEHIEHDHTALKELARVLELSGQLVATFPHRKFYFARDDRFVHHFRRYELDEMKDRLQAVGLRPVCVKKVLGPVDKIMMWLAVSCFSLREKGKSSERSAARRSSLLTILAYFFKVANQILAGIAWIDARIMPRSLASILLIKAIKEQQ